ncbi:MAG: pyridoxine 5-phosphate synthase [Devosia sp.]|nr:pyridoxine 5-phosphate synthase [Devosia sp.]
MTKLSVNLNAVAQLRNRRNLPWPSVTGIARVVLDAGADGITVHPRPDERHIRRSDVDDLVALLRVEYQGRELNIEGYPSEGFLRLVERARPDQVTFVPDDPGQATSDHGWDIPGNLELLRAITTRMHEADIRVSLFIDAEPDMPAQVAAVGADRFELYTGPYGAGFTAEARAPELARIAAAVEAARRIGHNGAPGSGLGINAGHDLTLDNLPALKQVIPELAEVSIGHAITADALLVGFADAVRRYKAALDV